MGRFGGNYGGNYDVYPPITDNDSSEALKEIVDKFMKNKEEEILDDVKNNWDQYMEILSELSEKLYEHLEELPEHLIMLVTKFLELLPHIFK